MNITNGVRIQEALEVSRNVVNNQIMITLIEQAINKVYNGELWIEPFEDSKLRFTYDNRNDKNWQTNLAEKMRKLLNLMEIDINDQLEKLMKVLPELTYLIVGAVLIFFVLVVLVPVMQVYMGTFAFSAFNV